MKKLIVGALVAFTSVCAAQAQVVSPVGSEARDTVLPDFSATSASKVTLFEPFSATPVLTNYDSLNTAALSTASLNAAPPAMFATALAVPVEEADPAPVPPAPRPKFLYGGRDDYRWQLGLGFAWERFRSSIFNASAVGLNSSVSYFLNDWLGIEGAFATVFAPPLELGEHVKIFNFGGGPKIAWRQRRWEPWVHGIFGGTHVQPQTAGNSRLGYLIQAGGGADFRWNPRLSFRLQADYLRNGLYKQSENNFQLGAGLVFHF
jgi:hypothetical protein